MSTTTTVKKLLTVEARVADLAAAREVVAELNARLKDAEAVVDNLEMIVRNSLLDSGLESIRSGKATVSLKRSLVPAVNDWQALDKFILRTKSLDLLQRRVSVTAWRERTEAGVKVPGVDAFERVDLAWRSAK